MLYFANREYLLNRLNITKTYVQVEIYGPRRDKRALSAAQYKRHTTVRKFDLVNLRARLSTGPTQQPWRC